MNNPLSIVMAHILAKGHADAALLQFNDLERVASERKPAGLGLDINEHLGRAIPAATSLALALELALKVCHYQNHGTYPRTHNLEDIVKALPTETKDVLAKNYRELYGRDIYIHVMHIRVSLGQVDESTPPLPVPNLSEFNNGLAHASAAYVKWRYLYEHMDSPETMHVHFKALLSLVEAAHCAIAAHVGDVRVSIADPR